MPDERLVHLTRRQRAGSIFWSLVSVLLGWTLFAYWWAKVLGERPPRELVVLLLLIVLATLVLLAAVLGWIWHNRRLAMRGVRGSSARFEVPVFEQDALGREISLPENRAMRAAPIITVEATSEAKVFNAELPNEA